jgi:hypothetical protein
MFGKRQKVRPWGLEPEFGGVSPGASMCGGPSVRHGFFTVIKKARRVTIPVPVRLGATSFRRYGTNQRRHTEIQRTFGMAPKKSFCAQQPPVLL